MGRESRWEGKKTVTPVNEERQRATSRSQKCDDEAWTVEQTRVTLQSENGLNQKETLDQSTLILYWWLISSTAAAWPSRVSGFLLKPVEKKNGSAGPCPHVGGYFYAVWPFTHAQTDFRSIKIRVFGKIFLKTPLYCWWVLMSSLCPTFIFVQLYLRKRQQINGRQNQNSATSVFLLHWEQENV